jgi:hypothetical protein
MSWFIDQFSRPELQDLVHESATAGQPQHSAAAAGSSSVSSRQTLAAVASLKRGVLARLVGFGALTLTALWAAYIGYRDGRKVLLHAMPCTRCACLSPA